MVLDIGQSAVDSASMAAIQYFFDKLPGENLSKFKNNNLVSLNQKKKKKQQKENHRHTYKLSIANMAYIRDVLIPFFFWFSYLIFKKTKRLSRLENYLKFKGHGSTIYGWRC